MKSKQGATGGSAVTGLPIEGRPDRGSGARGPGRRLTSAGHEGRLLDQRICPLAELRRDRQAERSSLRLA
jgi:hypothetical protein